MTTSVSQQFVLDRGRVFVAGLFWHALIASDPKGEARQIAKQQAFQMGVFRLIDGRIAQAGFGSIKAGHKPGMLSAAAVVSKTIEIEGQGRHRDFMVAAKIPGDRFLYVIQRDGAIYPNGDFIGSEDEVQARMLQDQSIGSWGYVAAPAHWGISGSENRSFESFLPRKEGKSGSRVDYHKWWALQLLQRSIGKYVLSAIGIAGLIAVPYYGIQVWQERQAAEEAARAAAAAQAAGQMIIQQEHPWKKIPRAQDFVAACMDGIDRIPSLTPGNWTVGDITCDGSAVAIRWMRNEGGWIEHLRLIAPEVRTSPDGQGAALAIPITITAELTDEAVPDERARSLSLHAVSQIYRFTGFTFTAGAAAPALPGQPQSQQPPPPEWREMKWAMTGTNMSPGLVAAALDGPGFRMSSIKAVVNGGLISWSMEGTQYVAP